MMHGVLAATLAALIVSRLGELTLSARHERVLRARGAREFGRAHFPLFVALHAAFPVALWVEGGRVVSVPVWWPAAASVACAAQALRLWSMRALGPYWTARVWVVPGEYAPRRGPYRWLAEPSYTAVTLELAALPLAFGAWRTALAASLVNAVALAIRIPGERRALREVALAPPPAAQ